MENFKRIDYAMDPKPLLAAIETNPDLWKQITLRQSFADSPHADTESIFLRWCNIPTPSAAFNVIPAVDYPALSQVPEARILIDGLLKALDLTPENLGRALIVNLKPDGYISPHADEGAYPDHYERFHICLASEEGNVFFVQTNGQTGEFVHMRPGETWWFNHKRIHFVKNESSKPRLHLIVDAVAPLYRKERDAVCL